MKLNPLSVVGEFISAIIIIIVAFMVFGALYSQPFISPPKLITSFSFIIWIAILVMIFTALMKLYEMIRQ